MAQLFLFLTKKLSDKNCSKQDSPHPVPSSRRGFGGFSPAKKSSKPS